MCILYTKRRFDCVHLQMRHKQFHGDVIKWKPFPRYWPFVWEIHRSPMNSHHKGHWRGALMISLICAWINSRVNNCDLRRHRAHYDVIVIFMWCAVTICWIPFRINLFINVVCRPEYLRLINLTHWGRDKMAAISQTHFQMHFLEWKLYNFD